MNAPPKQTLTCGCRSWWPKEVWLCDHHQRLYDAAVKHRRWAERFPRALGITDA